MGSLQDFFDRTWKEQFNYDLACATLFRRIVKAKELDLTEEQVQFVVKAITSASDGPLDASLDVPGLNEDFTITKQDFDSALAEFSSELESIAERFVGAAMDSLPSDILRALYADAPDALQHRRDQEAEFRDRLSITWRDGIDRLEMLVMIAQESGNMYVSDLKQDEQSGATFSRDEVSMLNALVALHARACRTACEVLCLLKGGLADGAVARWRSLHEIAVTAMFLMEHPGDTPQRYLDHAAIERRKSAKQYQEHCKTLNCEPYSTEEISEFESDADCVINKYGPEFKSDYGWAATALGMTRPTFADVEKSLQMSHWRPHYRLACGSVHAGSHALHSTPAVPEGVDDILLAGPSDAGLSDPGCNSARSLMLASVALFTFRPNLDSLIVCKCMETLCDDIDLAFEAAVASEDAS